MSISVECLKYIKTKFYLLFIIPAVFSAWDILFKDTNYMITKNMNLLNTFICSMFYDLGVFIYHRLFNVFVFIRQILINFWNLFSDFVHEVIAFLNKFFNNFFEYLRLFVIHIKDYVIEFVLNYVTIFIEFMKFLFSPLSVIDGYMSNIMNNEFKVISYYLFLISLVSFF